MTFTGEATIVAGDREFRLPVRLPARFEPVEGRHRWAGRAAPDDDLAAAFRSGVRDVTVRTADGGVARPARLGEPDPWGGVRIAGVGAPPWDLGF